MKIFLLLLSFASAFASTPVDQLRPGKYGSDRGMKYPIEIRPQESIGPIRLGASRAEVAALGMKVVPVLSLPDSEIVGRYSVHYERGRVGYVEIDLGDLPARVTYLGKVLPQSRTLEGAAKKFPGCGPRRGGFGGEWIDCRGLRLSRGSGWGSVTIRIGMPEPPPAPLPYGLIKLLNKNKSTDQK